jgi:hypothetical protein
MHFGIDVRFADLLFNQGLEVTEHDPPHMTLIRRGLGRAK